MVNYIYPMSLSILHTVFPIFLSPNDAQNPIFSLVEGIPTNHLITVTAGAKLTVHQQNKSNHTW